MQGHLTHTRLVNCSVVSVSIGFYASLIAVYLLGAVVWMLQKWKKTTAEIQNWFIFLPVLKFMQLALYLVYTT